ncbi:MAG TPA: oligosaccharide flippase family protein [Geminicoccaceae bacterium]|nr:oligosaccharide flippase family protein [Geminicoccaceae bacterium]
MIARLRGLLQKPLARDIFILYAVRTVNQLLPLATIPYLARVLGPAEWGMVAVAQAFAMYGIITIQYGFDMAATREVARHRHDPAHLGELMGGILACQLMLSGLVAVAAWLASISVPVFADEPRLIHVALAFVIIQGMGLGWYFTGMERISLMAGIELPTKLACVAAIFWMVEGPGHGWRVLAAYGGAAALAAAIEYTLMLRHISPRRPGLTRVRETFRLGFSVFVMQISNLINTAGSAFLLSLLATPQQVAYFAAPDKLARPLAWLTAPINRVLLPRISHLLLHRPDQAHAMARISLLVLLLVGLGFCLFVTLLAPWLIALVFGPDYEEAAPVLRVLALIIPLSILTDALAAQWLIPHGLDRPLSLTILAAAVLAVGLALVVVPAYHALGMAWVIVFVELFILAGQLLTLAYHRRRIFAGRASGPAARQPITSHPRS